MKFLLLLTALPIVTAIICPSGYTDKGDGTCYKFSSASSRNSAYDYCGKDNAYIYNIPNAFANSWVQQQVSSSYEVWLGMTCIGYTSISCVWDNGIPITSTSYTNFAPGSPNINEGSCVKMDVRTGQWLSDDCSSYNNKYAICKYTPENEVPTCNSDQIRYDHGVFRGDCYSYIVSSTETSDRSLCASIGAQVASIHNPGVNRFILGLAHNARSSNLYMFTGLVWNGWNYYWKDNSPVNYTNFGYENTGIGNCVSMALTKDAILPGQWINTQCVDNIQSLGVTCKQTAFTPPPTQTPLQCNGTQFLSGSGNLLSPGYPRGSETNQCEYIITESPGLLAAISFNTISLDSQSSIKLYSSLFETTPFATLNWVVSNYGYFQSSTNLMKIVFTTSGSSNFNNYFNALYSDADQFITQTSSSETLTYGYTEALTETTTETTTETLSASPDSSTTGSTTFTGSSTTSDDSGSLSCTFILDWDYFGYNPTQYLKQRDFVIAVSNMLSQNIWNGFAANFGIYGNTDSTLCSSSILPITDYQYPYTFANILRNYSPSTTCPLEMCDALQYLTRFYSREYPPLTCLVFLSGGRQDFKSCSNSINRDTFNKIIGAALTSSSKVSQIADSVVYISPNFTQDDVNSLVYAIMTTSFN